MNKKGYILIYVLGIVATVLFLASMLTSFTMQRIHNINRNEQQLKRQAEAEAVIEAVSMELASFFKQQLDQIDPEAELVHIKDLFKDYDYADFFLELEDFYGVSITLVENEQGNLPYTLKYHLSYDIAERDLYVTNIPSFLHFALGSKSDVHLFGGVYIDGSVYVEKDLYISNNIHYIDNYTLYYQKVLSSLPYFKSGSDLYLRGQIYTCEVNIGTDETCYRYDSDTNTFSYPNNRFMTVNDRTMYNLSFLGEAPTLLQYQYRFLDVNIDQSFAYYLRNTLIASIPEQEQKIRNGSLKTLLQESKNNGWLPLYTNVNDVTGIGESIYFTDSIEINHNFSYNKSYQNQSRWVIVDGDLTISNKGIYPITVDANFLVTGDVTIIGNVNINSIIYSLNEGSNRKTLIDSATINTVNDQSNLVLFSKGKIQFSKINLYNNKTSMTPDIEGFFYTDEYIDLYAVSSNFVIRGGLFAKGGMVNESETVPHYAGEYGILVNAYRGDVNKMIRDFDFKINTNYNQSRLKIIHSQQILNEQPEGLPLNNAFNYVFTDIKFKK